MSLIPCFHASKAASEAHLSHMIKNRRGSTAQSAAAAYKTVKPVPCRLNLKLVTDSLTPIQRVLHCIARHGAVDHPPNAKRILVLQLIRQASLRKILVADGPRKAEDRLAAD
jgi:hypothetical protein